MPTIYQIITVALFVAFIILTITKNGFRAELRDKAVERNMDIFADLLECDLCFSFWVSVTICLILSILNRDLSFLAVPVFSTPISRFIL